MGPQERAFVSQDAKSRVAEDASKGRVRAGEVSPSRSVTCSDPLQLGRLHREETGSVPGALLTDGTVLPTGL